jgi:hypothetical protein
MTIRLDLKRVLLAAGLCLASLSACSLTGGPVQGVVVDESTGKPVAGAIVVAHWQGTVMKLHGASASCYHVETARTDAQGRYRIAAWTRQFSASDIRLVREGTHFEAYKPGYWRPTHPDPAGDGTRIAIAPFQGTKDEYFRTVLGAPGWACLRPGASSKNEYRLFKAMAEEARALAETPVQMGRAQTLAQLAEESLVNTDKPTQDVRGRLKNTDPRDSFKMEEVPQ